AAVLRGPGGRAPAGPGAALRPRAGVRGVGAGHGARLNRLLSDVGGPDGISDPTCRGKPWVTPITEIDAYRRFYQLILLASQGVAIGGISNASPATPGFGTPPAADAQALATGLRDVFPQGGIGSNAVAIGSAGMADHQ